MSSCHVNCSGQPPPLSPDNDITGPGVITNYIASAGIAVVVILLYFFLVYEPARDPFEKDGMTLEDRPFRANPIDQMVTRKVRSWFRVSINEQLKDRLEESLIKCVVAMGDLQLITGFSILVSGALQLDCGLTVYEWQIIVYLTWFSCLTHLSCLMVLRSYLYVHTFGRTWRLVAMGILATLLIMGLLPTANYGALYTARPGPSDYAKCYLAIHPSSEIELWSMVLSVLIIAIGFISRVMKLHKMLSVTIWGNLRTWASVRARGMLRVVYKLCTTRSRARGLSFSLVYRPLFAVFLAARFVLDAWSSMFVEALWLFFAFLWGVIRLMIALNDTPREYDLWTKTASHDRGNWTFGQVVSLVLLATPLLTLLEYFDRDPSTCPRRPLAREVSGLLEPMSRTSDPNPPPSIETMLDAEDPDGNWSNQSKTLGMVIIYGLISLINIITVLFLQSINGSLIEVLANLYWVIKVILVLTGVYGIVLFSLLIQSEVSGKSPRIQGCLQFLNLAFYVISFNCEASYYDSKSHLWLNYLQLFALGFYALVAVVFLWARGIRQMASKL